MNHSKKIILVLLAISFSAIMAVSFAYAQAPAEYKSISPSSSPVSNNNSTDQPPHVIPYHPRYPATYEKEKQQLDLITVNLPKPAGGTSKPLSVASNVNINPVGFDGHNAASSGGFTPPDVQVAVGTNHVMELVNVKGEIWNKAGVSLQNITLSSFFGFSSTHSLGDPKILFDNMSGTNGRWYATILDSTNNTIGIAVSKTNDPTGAWFNIHDSGYSGSCADQPKIGLSDDKFVISVNDFQESCATAVTSLGAEFHVFDKTQLVNGIKSRQIPGTQPIVSDFGIMPVHSMSPTSPLYMVSDGGVSTNQILLYNLTGQVPSVSYSTSTVKVRTVHLPPNAKQPITTTLLQTGDERILDGSWYKGKLWFSLNDGCTPTGDTGQRSCARLIQINTNVTNGKKIQDLDINATGNYYYYPAIRLDGLGGMGVITGISSSDLDNNIYPSLVVTGQTAFDSANSTQQLSYLKTGSQYEEQDYANNNGLSRYGDYFGAALDPSNSSKIWVGGEYNKLPPNHNLVPTWSTWIGSITLPYCQVPTSGNWIISSSCTLKSSSSAPANVIVQNNSVLTIPTGLSLNVDFSQYHLLINYGSGVFIQPGGKIT